MRAGQRLIDIALEVIERHRPLMFIVIWNR
jgi:hypothetical protein